MMSLIIQPGLRKLQVNVGFTMFDNQRMRIREQFYFFRFISVISDMCMKEIKSPLWVTA